MSRGEIWANCIETEYLLEAARNAPSCDGIDSDKVRMLSKREVQVAEGAAQGYSNKQIADQFRLSEHTVKNYLSRVFEKLGVSNRFELLFLLFNEGNGLSSRAAGANVSGLGNPIEVYLKAAEEGYAAAQFIVGLAHLEGCGVEKNGHSAYYWLRMAEENSSAVRQRSRSLTEDLGIKMNPKEIESLEKSIATGARCCKMCWQKSCAALAAPPLCHLPREHYRVSEDCRGGLPFRKYAVSLIFADQAKPNVAGANGQQFPREVRLINKIDAVTEQLPDQHRVRG